MPQIKDSFTVIPPIDAGITPIQTIPMYTTAATVNPADATTQDQMRLVETSGILEFWNDPAEDVYEDDDGL